LVWRRRLKWTKYIIFGGQISNIKIIGSAGSSMIGQFTETMLKSTGKLVQYTEAIKGEGKSPWEDAVYLGMGTMDHSEVRR
jgi:hypothetical protein